MTNAYFENLKNNTPEDNGIIMLAAAQELETFAIRYFRYFRYCKTHKPAKQTQVMSQKWFGEC